MLKMLKMLKKIKSFLILMVCFFCLNCYAFSSDSIYNLNSELTDKNGIVNNLGDLSGKVQVFSMIYTNCKTICPIIVANMKSIEKLVPKNVLDDVQFSLISLDPDRDSVPTLSKFFKEKKLNSKYWNLFKTTKDDTLKISLAVGVKYKKEKNNEYTHSNLIIILDKNGVIKMHHQGLDKNYSNVIKLISSLSK